MSLEIATAADIEAFESTAEAKGFAFMTGADLMSMPLKEVTPIISNFVMPAQLTILAGKPKAGKSILALEACEAVTSGQPFMGKLGVDKGPALYFMADDPSESRFASRWQAISRTNGASFHIALERWTIGPEALAGVEAAISTHRPKLVVIDCLQAIRSPRIGSDFVAGEYNEARILTDLAERTGTAVVLVHHMNKGSHDDPFDSVASSFGLTAAASTIALYHKLDPGRPERVLRAQGRDISPPPVLTYMGPDKRLHAAAVGHEIISHWKALYIMATARDQSSFTAKDLGETMGITDRWARSHLRALYEAGAITQVERGSYIVIDEFRESAAAVQKMFREGVNP